MKGRQANQEFVGRRRHACICILRSRQCVGRWWVAGGGCWSDRFVFVEDFLSRGGKVESMSILECDRAKTPTFVDGVK